MSTPSKIPILFALDWLKTNYRGRNKPLKLITIDNLRDISGDQELVDVSDLRPFFSGVQAFNKFKKELYVPDKYWKTAMRVDPSIKEYAKKFMGNSSVKKPKKKGRPRKKRIHKLSAKLGEYSDSEISSVDSDSSVLSIVPSSDECDETDVNFPMPVCQGIRKICRVYDKSRRYLPYIKDKSDDERYHFKVQYD